MGANQPLAGRTALVTGLSRRIGIGYAIVARLLDDGASVFATGWSAHDAEMPWGPDPFDADGHPFVDASDDGHDRFAYAEADLADPDAPSRLVDAAVERFGAIDIVVANHARSSHTNLAEVTPDELDACWAVNARASVLLAQALDRAHDGSRPGGRLVLFTSGQDFGPMDNEIAYAISKGAIHQMTASLANAVADKGITVNTINPGPVDTGYASGTMHAAVAQAFPAKRWGRPDDVARLVAWLVSDEAGWINGQVINSEGGWRRWEVGRHRRD
ncbi:MAG: SDR family oxidoreductase [Acidimicrobiia bacterium]|nr:SDR family oxidoreductase [Acidimicrobiia bacterium]